MNVEACLFKLISLHPSSEIVLFVRLNKLLLVKLLMTVISFLRIFLHYLPVIIDMISKAWLFMIYLQDPKHLKIRKQSRTKIFPIEDNAFL